MTEIVERSVEVDVPVRTAYNQWTQFEQFPSFMEGVEQVTQVDDTHLHWKTKIAGVTREFDAEIYDQHPDEKIAWRSTSGATHAGTVSFQALGAGRTKINLQLQAEPDGIVEKAGAELGLLERRVSGDLERFKGLIESQGAESGAWRGEIHHGDVHTASVTAAGPPGLTGAL